MKRTFTKYPSNYVKASSDSSRFIPAQRTAVDGKTWWVVWDSDAGSYSTLTCFGKYKNRKDCQLAIDLYISPRDAKDLDAVRRIAQRQAAQFGESISILQDKYGNYSTALKSLQSTMPSHYWNEVEVID